jgi:excisionase family DNA binding protein
LTAGRTTLDAVPTLYTAEEAAKVLRVRQSWLERQAAARKIPFTMLGGCYRFTTDHLTEIVRIFESAPVTTPATAPAASPPRSRDRAAARGVNPLAQPLKARPRRRRMAA